MYRRTALGWEIRPSESMATGAPPPTRLEATKSYSHLRLCIRPSSGSSYACLARHEQPVQIGYILLMRTDEQAILGAGFLAFGMTFGLPSLTTARRWRQIREPRLEEEDRLGMLCSKQRASGCRSWQDRPNQLGGNCGGLSTSLATSQSPAFGQRRDYLVLAHCENYIRMLRACASRDPLGQICTAGSRGTV